MKAQVLIALALLAPAGSALAQHPNPHPEVRHDPHACGPAQGPNHHGGYGVGSYDLKFDLHGQPNSGVLRISCTEGKLGGILEVHGEAIPLEVTGLADMQITLSGGPELTLTLNFKTLDEFTGKWAHSGDTGTLTGTRQKS